MKLHLWLVVVCVAMASPARAQISLGGPYSQDFDTLASTAPSMSTPAGWTFSEVGSNANTTYAVGIGSSAIGDTYSFGAIGSTDRAFGTLASGSLRSTLGARFTNATGAAITDLWIEYNGEQWRVGGSGNPDRLDFQYSTDATSLTTGTWTDVDALDFSSRATTPTGAANGNGVAFRRQIAGAISGLGVAPSATVWIRWVDLDILGTDDGLAIDDFTIASVPPCLDEGATSCGTDGTRGTGGVCNSYPAGTECRAATGGCDIAETCSGVASGCGADQIAGAGAVCRASAGVCDVAESCDGISTACPADVFVSGGVCRAANGDCDVEETCSGASASCPSDAFLGASAECRPASSVCDAAERCTGLDGACPADIAAADGTSCADADMCDGNERCASGACTKGAPPVCDDADACTTDTCDPTIGCTNTLIMGCWDGGLPDASTAEDAGPTPDAGTADDAGGGGGMEGGCGCRAVPRQRPFLLLPFAALVVALRLGGASKRRVRPR